MNNLRVVSLVGGSATQRSYLKLRSMIVRGEIAPGRKLKIDELRDVLDVGASPIREALSLLTSDYLVERMDQRGFRAAPTSRENFEEILQLRSALEERALRQGMENSTHDWHQGLEYALERLGDHGQSTDQQEEAHRTLHLVISSNCKGPIVRRYITQLYDLSSRYQNLSALNAKVPRKICVEDHREIVHAILSQNQDLAVSKLVSHYHATGQGLLDGYLRVKEQPGAL